jgi:DNA invertase Pin-like site-specific DNA recombinase
MGWPDVLMTRAASARRRGISPIITLIYAQKEVYRSLLKPAFSYVRFSSSEQSKGDSLCRQTDLAEGYAQRHGLQLDRELTFRDLGVSAFTAKNKTEGALAAFIKACKSGRVKPGSALLVESLDRLSREQVRKALRQLLELIDDHGMEVHTLADNRVYGPGTQTEELVISIIVMSRVHEESERKSQRVAIASRPAQDGRLQSGASDAGLQCRCSGRS